MATRKRARRLRGEGSISERADGRFEIRFPMPVGPDGKRHRLYRYASTKADALSTLATLRLEAKHPLRSDGLTVAEYLLDRWLPVMRSELRSGTYGVYATTVRLYLIPVVGDVKLTDLTPEHAERVKAFALKTLSPNTVRTVRTIFGSALKKAERWQIAGVENVVRLTDPPKVERREYRFLTVTEARALLEAASASPHGTLYRVTLSLGLRMGEVLGLCWSDVDLDNGMLTIAHTLQHDRGQLKLLPTKTEASHATIPMPKPVTAALTELKARQAYQKINAPIWLDSWGLCFTGPHGEYVVRSALRHDFARVLRRAGLRSMRFHDLRHSAASIMLAQGVPMKVVQLTLRHARIGTTMDTYAHLLPEALGQAAEAMERALG